MIKLCFHTTRSCFPDMVLKISVFPPKFPSTSTSTFIITILYALPCTVSLVQHAGDLTGFPHQYDFQYFMTHPLSNDYW